MIKQNPEYENTRTTHSCMHSRVIAAFSTQSAMTFLEHCWQRNLFLLVLLFYPTNRRRKSYSQHIRSRINGKQYGHMVHREGGHVARAALLVESEGGTGEQAIRFSKDPSV